MQEIRRNANDVGAAIQVATTGQREMIRVGIDGHVLTGRFQGTRSTLSALLRSLASRLEEREVIIYSDHPEEARALLGVDGYRFADLGHTGPIKRLLSVFPKLFRRDRVDIGVFQYMSPLTGRHIIFIHDLLPISHPHFFPFLMRLRTRIFFSLAIRRAAMVLVVSNFTRSEVERLYQLSPDRLRVVLNGPSFPMHTFAGEHHPAAERYILAVGRIEPRKNVPMLVDAVLKADVRGVKLVVVGSHDNGFGYRLPDDPRVEWKQGVTNEALIELYRGASLVVYPSAAEGFGIPLLDALLFGIPVIASDRTAMAEIATGVAALFDPTAPGATDLLAERIAGHFGDHPVLAPSSAEREDLARRFSWDRAAEDFLAAVDSVAG
jgi:glycosyltransferase involved in cell wall biosynthesis